MPNIIEAIMQKTEEVYEQLLADSDRRLSKAEVESILTPEYAEYYTDVVQGLVAIKKVVRNMGFHGGISMMTGVRGLRPELNEYNKRALATYFADVSFDRVEIEEVPAEPDAEIRLEAEFYPPLKEYLENRGLYKHVVINRKLSGSKWENADLAAVMYETDLRYSGSIDLQLTAIEVKRGFPTVKSIQQAAAYLPYAHYSYICYFDDRFKGTNIDLASTRLRDEGCWDLINTFGLGVIVAYKAQDRGTALYFQTVKEAPYHPVELRNIEKGIELWLDEEAKQGIREALVKQNQRIASMLES